MLKPDHPEQTDCRVCSGFPAQTKNEMLRLVRVQLRKAENRIPVDGTRCARHRCIVSRLVDVATVRFVSKGMSTLRRGRVPLAPKPGDQLANLFLSYRQQAVGTPGSKRFVKRNQNTLSRLGKREQPCIGPNFGRCRSPRCLLAKPLLHLWWFRDKRHTVVFVQSVIDSPCCSDRQRLAVHYRSRGHKT
jgi:hypothetical protein